MANSRYGGKKLLSSDFTTLASTIISGWRQSVSYTAEGILSVIRHLLKSFGCDRQTALGDTPITTPEGFDILYEEGPCLVVVKPGGVATQAPAGIDSLEVRVKEFLRVRDDKKGNVYLGVPHRLDRPVSGVIVLARHVRAARRLAEQFAARTVRKTYWTVVEGSVQPDQGTWIDYLRKIPDEARVEVVAPDHPEARQAVLHYRVLATDRSSSWLEIELETGRMHQIRVQAACRSHPILGDAQYAAVTSFGPVTADFRSRWIALHARSLEFRHPMTREVVCQTAPLPSVWQSVALSSMIAARQE